MKSFISIILGLGLSGGMAAGEKAPVKVFLLLGQSNMQGKGSMGHLKELVKTQPEKYGHLMEGDQWVVRDDVWGAFHNQNRGPLRVGTLTRPGGRVGPEIGFGKVVGDALEEPVLLLKIAWGGQSLAVDFRPPSAGKWDREFNRDDGKSYKPATVGWAYKQVFNEMKMSLDNPKETFPDLADREFELAGIVWFQGWNDMINGGYLAEYKDNLVKFIRDLRLHLEKENLPFVIGVGGHGGDNPNGKAKMLREAQTAPASMKEFKDNVAAVQTAPFWDPEPHGDGGYHYNGSASFFYDAGAAFGEAMLDLLSKQEAASSSEPEKRTFRSADGTKSFEAFLTGYDPGSGMVTVRKVNGRTVRFKIDMLSEEDQAYVKKRGK